MSFVSFSMSYAEEVKKKTKKIYFFSRLIWQIFDINRNKLVDSGPLPTDYSCRPVDSQTIISVRYKK